MDKIDVAVNVETMLECSLRRFGYVRGGNL
jgi:hypothetical protein